MSESIAQPQPQFSKEQIAYFQSLVERAPKAFAEMLSNMGGLTSEEFFSSIQSVSDLPSLRRIAFEAMPQSVRDTFFGFCPRPPVSDSLNTNAVRSIEDQKAAREEELDKKYEG
jgi:hypothetical protein